MTIALSAEQEAACSTLCGPVRIVAGAGTGKTAVIAERVRRHLIEGADPAQILVMTFTERAASEMRERISEATASDLPNVGTFHSMALRWLREEGGGGLPPMFRILAGADQWIFLRELLWELGQPALAGSERPDDLVHPLLKLQERLKQELVPLVRLAEWARRRARPDQRDIYLAAAQLFSAYADRCRQQGLADFDDLLLLAVRMLETRDNVRARLRERHPLILVDEYQDCNAAQERLVELLGAPDGDVCVVGDDDQSIYRFRGASRASMERFAARFPIARTLALGANWRSQRRIVVSAGTLIERNAGRLPKPLRPAPDAPAGCRVEVWRCGDLRAEASAIADRSLRLMESGVPLNEIAVLTRTHAIARPVLEAFDSAGVPAHHWAAHGFFRRAEVRDLVAYLRLLANPGDLHALARLLARPPLCLDLEEGMEQARGDRVEIEDVTGPLHRLRAWAPTSAWAGAVLEVVPQTARLGVEELLFEVLERTRHLEAVIPAGGIERQRMLANVGRFSELVAEYCERRRDHSLNHFVEYLDLVLRSGIDEEVPPVEAGSEAVQVMSIHQAKGLEFEVVFVPALVEGRLPQPHRRDGMELPGELAEPHVRGRADHLAEERRLLYVAMTRARSHLHLSWAERYDGAREWRPSRFLEELDGEVEHRLLPARPVPLREEATPAGDEGEAPTLSFSAIDTYRECPRQYWFRYRLHLPSPPVVEAQLGSVVHDALLRAGRSRQDGQELDERLLRELYDEAWDGVTLAEPRRRPVVEALGWRLLREFWLAGGLEARPHLLERSFTADMVGWRLRGIIDRIDEMPPLDVEGKPAGARWRIVDYKTGRPLPASRLRRDLQLALYALGARQGLGLEDVELEIAYLRDGHQVRVEALEELLEDAGRIGREVAGGIQRGRFEPRPERRRCGLCAYRLACEAAW